MLTEKQTTLYWRLWKSVCLARGWTMTKGRLIIDPERENQFGNQVIEAARQIAAGHHRVPVLDDLRHAVTRLATGKWSITKLNHCGDFTKLVSWMKMLVNDADLNAAIQNTNTEADHRRRLIWRIRRAAPLPYIAEICRDQFPNYVHPFWDDLPTVDLDNLIKTLSQRTKHFSEPVQAVADSSQLPPLENYDNEPF